MSGVSLLSANLATICIESLFYGIFLVLSTASLYLLARRREQLISSPLNIRVVRQVSYMTPMSIAAACLFVTNTAHWIIGVYRAFQAFVNYEGGTQPEQYFSAVPQPSEVTQTALLMVSLIIGDTTLVYRLWIIWAYSLPVVIFPICTLIGLTACAIGVIYQESMLKPGEDIFISATGRWITANCVLTLCTNVYGTAFISWKIWRANREAERFGGGSLMGVLGILVESAALYTAWTILFFVTYHIRSNLQFTCSDTYCVIAGITFMLINVRVGMGWAQRAPNHSHSSSGAATSAEHGGRQIGMGPLAVNITRVVHRDDGPEPPIKFASCSSVELPSPPT